MLKVPPQISVSKSGRSLALLLFCCLWLFGMQDVAESATIESKFTECPAYSRLSAPSGLSAYFVNSNFIEISWNELPPAWIQGLQAEQAQIVVFVEAGGQQQDTGLPLSSYATRFGGLPSSSNVTVTLAVANGQYVISEVSKFQLDSTSVPSPSTSGQLPTASPPTIPRGQWDDPLWYSDSNSILQLLSSYDFSNYRDFAGQTPLHIAASRDLLEVAEYLLGLPGADPNSGPRRSFTPLHFAADENSVATARVLIRFGANPDAITPDGLTPLHIATQDRHVEVMRQLLDAGAHGDIRAFNGLTPLHMAANSNSLDALAVLLQYDHFDLDVRNDNGFSPLHAAVYRELTDHVVLFLKRRDIEPDVEDLEGWTPLMRAAKNNLEEIAEELLDHRNTDPNTTVHPGFTALHIAIHNDKEDIVELLLDHPDIDPNLGDPNGQTPLSLAAYFDQYDIAEMLLDHRDTDPNIQDKFNNTPVNVAMFYGHTRILELLQEHGGERCCE